MYNLKNYIFAAALAGALYLGTAQASFGQSLINGNFTSLTPAAGGELGYNTTLTSWNANGGYIFVFPSGNRGDTNIQSSYGNFSLWGPNNGSTNGLVLPPGGGNVVAMDGAFQVAPLTQVVTGLTAGITYVVSFNWAGAQQSTYNGVTHDSISVALSSDTYANVFTQAADGNSGTLAGSQTTVTVDNASHGFTGWMSQSFNFTATGSSETLYFLANGSPTGVPPFSLLANITMTTIPEPKTSASWTILFVMLIMAGNWAWNRFFKKSAIVA